MAQFSNNTTSNDKPKATVFLNLGVNDADGKLISPFMGVAVDTANKPKFGGEQAQTLFQAIQAIGESLEAGEAKTLDLVVEIRKAKAELVAKDTDVASVMTALIK